MIRQFTPENNTLFCMVGLPYSGKTTWAIKSGYPIVSMDAIRMSFYGRRYLQQAEPHMWLLAHTMVDSLFRAGHTYVILDATNTTVKRRKEWYPKVGEGRSYSNIRFKWLSTSAEECIRRATALGDQEILPGIARMNEQFEGFTEVETPYVYDY